MQQLQYFSLTLRWRRPPSWIQPNCRIRALNYFWFLNSSWILSLIKIGQVCQKLTALVWKLEFGCDFSVWGYFCAVFRGYHSLNSSDVVQSYEGHFLAPDQIFWYLIEAWKGKNLSQHYIGRSGVDESLPNCAHMVMSASLMLKKCWYLKGRRLCKGSKIRVPYLRCIQAVQQHHQRAAWKIVS